MVEAKGERMSAWLACRPCKVERHAWPLERHARKLERHTRKLKRHARILERSARTLERSARSLERIARSLERIARSLERSARRLERHARTLESYHPVHGKNRAGCGAWNAVGGEWGLPARPSTLGAPGAERCARCVKRGGRRVGCPCTPLLAWWAKSCAPCAERIAPWAQS
jgi:hypothetical protein